MSKPSFVQRQVQGLRQEMVLMPRMLQSIEVLQLPSVELETYLLEAVQGNEALNLEPAPVDDGFSRAGRSNGEASDRFAAWLESQPAHEGGLQSNLLEQTMLLDLDEAELAWVRLVVRSLDTNGYLTPSDEELLALAEEEELVGGVAELGRAIAAVQGLEPKGIGGRDVIEALLLQLDPADEDYGLFCRVLEEFLDEVTKNKLPFVARSMGIEIGRLQELLLRMRDLEPAPGLALGGNAPPAIRPDVIVRASDAGFDVEVQQSGLPSVSIDTDISALASDAAVSKEVRTYLRGKLERARWLVDALEERKKTLLRIATVLFDHQRAFLEKGPGHLRPLRMGQVADVLGIHLSTVSRGVAGKYAETPWGLFALRHFFQAEAGGKTASVTSDVRASVKAVVDEEDPAKPLSDDEIAAELEKRGLEVARRTVAKYRRELGIQSSYRRRRYAG